MAQYIKKDGNLKPISFGSINEVAIINNLDSLAIDNGLSSNMGRVLDKKIFMGTTTGTATAMSIDLKSAFTSVTNGTKITVLFNNNPGTNATLATTSPVLAAKNIRVMKAGTLTNITAGELNNTYYYDLHYNGTYWIVDGYSDSLPSGNGILINDNTDSIYKLAGYSTYVSGATPKLYMGVNNETGLTMEYASSTNKHAYIGTIYSSGNKAVTVGTDDNSTDRNAYLSAKSSLLNVVSRFFVRAFDTQSTNNNIFELTSVNGATSQQGNFLVNLGAGNVLLSNKSQIKQVMDGTAAQDVVTLNQIYATGGLRIFNTTTISAGVAYGITDPLIPSAIPNGYTMVIIPNVASTSAAATLNINGTSAKNFYRRDATTGTIAVNTLATFLKVGYPQLVRYDNASNGWVLLEMPNVSSGGIIPSGNGILIRDNADTTLKMAGYSTGTASDVEIGFSANTCSSYTANSIYHSTLNSSIGVIQQSGNSGYYRLNVVGASSNTFTMTADATNTANPSLTLQGNRDILIDLNSGKNLRLNNISQIKEVKDPTALQDAVTVNYLNKRMYETKVGNGTLTTFTITHNLGTQAVMVVCRYIGSAIGNSGEEVQTTNRVTGNNTITITTEVAIPTDGMSVQVMSLGPTTITY